MNYQLVDSHHILENDFIKVIVQKDNGTYSIFDKEKDVCCINHAFARVNDFLVGYYDEESEDNKRKLYNRNQHKLVGNGEYLTYDRQRWHVKVGEAPHGCRVHQYPVTKMRVHSLECENQLGKGTSMVISCQREEAPTVELAITLYEHKKIVTFTCGIENTTDNAVCLTEFHPLSGAGIFEEMSHKVEVRALDGLSGNGLTHVSKGPLIQSSNNLLMTFKHEEERYSITVGGLGYDHFAKYFCIDRKDCVEQKGKHRPNVCCDQEMGQEKLDCMAYDPHGLRIEAGDSFTSDMFYLDFMTKDPFTSLEKYAKVVQKLNDVQVNSYQFPIVNCWYVSSRKYSLGHNINNTPATIKEMEKAKETGFFKYAPVAIQLEPDKYHGDTEQGWWDDEHFIQHGHYCGDYDTTKKWCDKLEEIGAVPYFYMQSGLPSDDFAKAYPGFMLNNDISKLYHNHNHHQTYVTFDYTDKEFQDYLMAKWGKLAEDGLQGVKFDYPETVWRPDGGFEDKYATTAKAYRTFFKTAREAFGKDMMINERNLGESNRPVVDVSIGYADTQRVWNDASSFVPQMVTKAGLRWYKNRVLYNYDIEAKTFFDKNIETDKFEAIEPYKLKSLLTMNYVVSGRLLMATSFRMLTPEMVYDLGRMFPIHEEQRMARPLDAFTDIEDPQVYDYKVNDDWHQLTLYNTREETAIVNTFFNEEAVNCGLELDVNEKYHVYEFWTDTYMGLYDGRATLSRHLRAGEAQMFSIHKQENYPQFISTNRHVMQGYVDLKDCYYDSYSKSLSGISSVVEHESYEVVIALNGEQIDSVICDKDIVYEIVETKHKEITKLNLLSTVSKDIKWTIKFIK